MLFLLQTWWSTCEVDILPYEVDVTAGLVVTPDFAMQRWFYCRNSACHVALLPVAALTTGLVDAM